MAKSDSSLREYIYVDNQRLDAYFQQISSPITYDKVPVWNVSVTSTGPAAQGQQARPARPYTTHEKVVALLNYLSKENLMLQGSLDDRGRWHEERVFCLDSVTARRVLVPPVTRPSEEVPGLNLWLASKPAHRTDHNNTGDSGRRTQHLYLIEDLQRSDSHYISNVSGYSALYMLASEIEKSHKERFGLTTDEEPNDIARRFSRDPAAFFAAAGARVLPEREVSVFYRLRAACNDMNAPERGALAIFGYVIAAWAASKNESNEMAHQKQKANRKWWKLWK